MRKYFLLVIFQGLLATGFAQDGYDASVVASIKAEEEKNSQVMDIAFHLTDVNGPRLTASPGFLKAANWAKEKLASWGLKNARLEPWGDFGKGWQQERCYIAMTKPYYQAMIGVPKAWTGSTPGGAIFKNDIVLITARDSAELMQYEGKLKNKIVMTLVSDTLRPSFEADAARFHDTVLNRMALAEPRVANPVGNRSSGGRNSSAFSFQRILTAFLAREKPALVLSMSGRGNDGTVFVSGGGVYAKDAPEAPASVMLSSDDYLRLYRLLSAGIPVELEAEVKNRFFDKDLKGYNVFAEIPGTDPKLKNEVVMLGGHLDSWHAATGATDNAAGCAVMMEAVRLIQSLNLKPRRTIRIALWGGEEQGLIGSRNYVKTHLADPATMKPTAEHGRISAYYNLDNGTGRIRGVYLQGNSAARSLFTRWLEPFHQMGASTVTINHTGGTDHTAFDAVGIPGFQFIQDPIEYDTRTHHTNMDTYDHLVPADLRQASAIVAAFVINTAQQQDMVPRKPLPEPVQTRRGF